MQEPSKLNTVLDVPTTAATLTPTVPTSPAPGMPMHATDVAVVQLDVAQSASATTAVTVPSVGAKLVPVSVTLATTDATLYGDAAVAAGAARHKKRHDGRMHEKSRIRRKRDNELLAHRTPSHHDRVRKHIIERSVL